jgi:hypothetical protein
LPRACWGARHNEGQSISSAQSAAPSCKRTH